MAYSKQLDQLSCELESLTEALRLMRVTFAEDKPSQADLVFVDRLRDSAEDCLGCAAEARFAQRSARQRDLAPASLACCQKQVNEISLRLSRDLGNWKIAFELDRLMRQHKGEWIGWVGEIERSLDRLQGPVHAANNALQACWEDLVVEQTSNRNIHPQVRESAGLAPADQME